MLGVGVLLTFKCLSGKTFVDLYKKYLPCCANKGFSHYLLTD